MKRINLYLFPMVLLAGCSPKTPESTAPKADAPVPITVASIAPRPYQQRVLGNGTLNGTEDISLALKVDGKIRAVYYQLGDLAIPGAVLLDLDSVDLRLAVAEAQAALDTELRALSLTTENFERFDVRANDAVIIARANFEKANKVFEPYPKLLETKAVSEFEFLQIKNDFDVAKARLRDTTSNTNSAYARAQQRRAALDIAKQRLADAELVVPEPPGWAAWSALVGPTGSPLRYAVAQRMISVGERVQSLPITNVYRLVISYMLKLRVTIPERHAAEVRVGQIVEVRVDAHGDRPFAARVARVNPTIDPANRTFQIEIEVPNLAGQLKPGGFARVAILGDTSTVTTIPPQALVSFAGVNKVFVQVGDKAKAIPVSVGIRERDWVEVRGEFPAGAPVLTSGFSRVVDGGPVVIRRESEVAR